MSALREQYNDQFVGHDWAHYLIRRIDLSKNRDANMAILLNSGIKKDPLKAVVTYLKGSFDDMYHEACDQLVTKKPTTTKSELVNLVIDFVSQTLPYNCLTCKTQYSPYMQANRSVGDVLCFLCSLPAHLSCIKENSINLEAGIVFLCEACVGSKGKNDVPPPENTDKPAQDDKTDTEDEITPWQPPPKERKKMLTRKRQSLDPSQRASQEIVEEVNSDSDEEEEDDDREICIHYQNSRCRYGLSGNGCKFYHPKICSKLIKHGNRAPHGCNLGRECTKFHPKLCWDSLKYKECTRTSCKFVHIRGTRRRQEHDTDGFNRGASQTNVTSTSVPGNQFRNTPVSQQYRNQPMSQQHTNQASEKSTFLEILQRLQIQMEEVQTQQSNFAQTVKSIHEQMQGRQGTLIAQAIPAHTFQQLGAANTPHVAIMNQPVPTQGAPQTYVPSAPSYSQTLQTKPQ